MLSLSCPDIHFTCFLKYQNHLIVLGFLIIQGIEMNLEGAAGSLLLPRTHRVAGPEGFSRHTGGNGVGGVPISFPSHAEVCARKRGEAGLSHFILFTRFIFLALDALLSYITCAITKNKNKSSKSRLVLLQPLPGRL